MKLDHTIRYDGPYLHVDLPDIVPPDWEDVRRDLDPEAAVSHAFITAPGRMGAAHERELRSLCDTLSLDGAKVSLIRLPEFAERYLG